jgi:hypothetical protein
VTTIFERLTQSAHLAEDDARRHLENRFVRVDGEVVTDPDTEITDDARLLLLPPPSE